MRITAWRVVAFLLLIALSVGFGFGFDAIATAVEKSNHPRPEALTWEIEQNAETYGIPEHILWATVKVNSDFVSNAVEMSGEIGLCQLTPAQFSFICTDLLGTEAMDAGMLYDPATNLRAGSVYLSYLYDRYGVWDHAFAAYRAGTETVDAWLADPALVSEQGVLKDIPDAKTAAFVSSMKQAVDSYAKLYYS